MSSDNLNQKRAFDHLNIRYQSNSAQETMEFYDKEFAKTYEKELKYLRLENAPEIFATFALKYMDNVGKSAKIIDIGAGTGLLGMELKKHGYHNLYGNDGSKEMLKIAEQKQIYKEHYLEMLLENKPSAVMPKREFDMLIALGTFGHMHMNEKHLETVIELVKPGGLMVFGFDKRACDDKFEHQVSLLSAKCSLIGSETIENYMLMRNEETGEIIHYQGILLAFKIL